MNALWKVASLTVLASLAGCFSHTREVVREQPIVQTQPTAVERERVVVVQPPAAPAETIPPSPAATGYSWVAGHYVWRENRWVWRPGQWVAGTVRPLPTAPAEEVTPAAPYTGARWVPGYWSLAGNDWTWVRGHWL